MGFNNMRIGLVFLICMGVSQLAFSGFLDLPDTTEVPEYERDTLLKDMDIPPVRDRDPDPEAGPRLNVTEFRLQGLVEFPELGITRQAIIDKVESIRFELMREGSQTESGYTLDELGEVSDLVAQIEKETEGKHVGPLEVQRLVFLIRDQRRRRGVTLGMIETVADTITQYYRERGFILAKAYIPKQQVRDGVVTLTLLLGELGEVEVVNNKKIRSKYVEKIFKEDMFEPVTSWRIEEALYLVNDTPGVTAQGFFQPGKQVGDTKLSVNILDEQRWTSNVRVDNHGSDTTGEYRVYADVYLLNPLGYGDQLQIGGLYTFEPSNTTYGSLRYTAPFFSSKWTASLGVSSNDFIFQSRQSNNAIDLDASVAGKSLVADVKFNYKWKRSRKKNLSFDIIFEDIGTELVVVGNDSTTDAINTTLNFNFDVINERSRRLHVGNISLVSSSIELDDGFGTVTSEDLFYLSYDYSMLSFIKLPFSKKESRLVFKSAGQIGGQGLESVNQFALAGPTRSRGYATNTGFFDDALYFGADWFFSFTSSDKKFLGTELNKAFQPYLFADVSYGILYAEEEAASNTDNADSGGDINGELSNIGFGMNMNFGGVRSNLSIAFPLSENIGLEEEKPSSTLYFDLQYSF